ncbi:hypothetical protein BN159_6866 [Streptomyces davaonensis JCM 4913]|uniref:Uncharacterized protein n=1 Tax=Streptomyces davaonensis (strain DSM 101723 / JCM 4913 / KCC S-0913 / 768) TaxID=1214101 RepID=K4RCY7_STRDJ|nr:hypothetical protein BN159_6866 [Streptomyces davaonensis JCM 4913]
MRPYDVLRRHLRGKILHQLSRPSIGKPHIPMPPLPLLDKQPTGDKLPQMLTDGRGGNPGMPSQLPGGPGPPVEQGEQTDGPSLIGDQGGKAGEVGCARIAIGHATQDGPRTLR